MADMTGVIFMRAKRALILILSFAMAFSAVIVASATELATSNTSEVVILHTNDTHCDIENGLGFAGVAAYMSDMEEIYGEDYVSLVDAGDAVQGGTVGMLTDGEAIIELMNLVGYDIMALGNHEFDYGIDQMFYLTSMFEGTIISSNFVEISTGNSVFDAYTIEDYGTFQVAFVGITTPETYTSTTPAYFQDEDGNYIYGFCEGDDGANLYANVQASVDSAVAEGADYVIAVAHLGIEETASPYTSTEVIENTTGIDVFLDGHSHSTVESEEIANKDGDIVIVNQTGEKFDNLGKITINNDTGEITAVLISSDDYTEKDETVQSAIDVINEENAVLLEQVIATSDISLYAYDPDTGAEIIRTQETNLGDFCADAYRYILETDIALVNGGGIQSDILSGDITYADVIEVHPWGNDATSVWASGQDILDALELGASIYPQDSGGFLQVSGLTYKIDYTVDSSVVTDEMGCFVEVTGEYRVYDVMVGDEPLELDKMYSVGSHDYLLLNGGDGMTMFSDCEVIKSMYMIDNEVLITYMQEVGISEDYADINGQGRIVFAEKLVYEDEDEDEEDFDESLDDSTVEDETEDETTDDTVDEEVLDEEVLDEEEFEDESEDESTSLPQTGDSNTVIILLSLTALSVTGTAFVAKKKFNL